MTTTNDQNLSEMSLEELFQHADSINTDYPEGYGVYDSAEESLENMESLEAPVKKLLAAMAETDKALEDLKRFAV